MTPMHDPWRAAGAVPPHGPTPQPLGWRGWLALATRIVRGWRRHQAALPRHQAHRSSSVADSTRTGKAFAEIFAAAKTRPEWDEEDDVIAKLAKQQHVKPCTNPATLRGESPLDDDASRVRSFAELCELANRRAAERQAEEGNDLNPT